MYPEIKFTYNWNNKLHCKCFSTIRISNNKYKVGEKYEIHLKNSKLFEAVIKDIQYFKPYDLTEHQARIDTGYSCKETINIIRKMYGNKMDVDKTTFMLITLENCNKFEPEQIQTKLL